jgi:signal transduction histidine kinase/ActR/RegA family two-component response regulator
MDTRDRRKRPDTFSYALALALCAAALTAYGIIAPGPRTIWALTAAGLCLGFVMVALHRRFERERAARLAAERDGRHAEHVQQVATALSKAQTPAEVAEAAVLECAYTFGAAAAVMVVIGDDESIELVHGVGVTSKVVERLKLLRFEDAKNPLADAARRRAMVALESRAAALARYGEDVDVVFHREHEAIAAVPVLLRGRVIAVLAVASLLAREWEQLDCEFLQSVSLRVAHALDRANAYQLAEQARAEAEDLRARADQELAERQKIEAALRDSEARYRALAARTSRLHSLTAGLSEALTLEAVANAVIRNAKLVVGAQAGSVALLVASGSQFEILADDSVTEDRRQRRFNVAAGLCATSAVETRQPVYVGSFAEWQRSYWRSAAQAADGGFESTVALPLLSEDKVIGVLSFHFTVPVNFDDEYKALLRSVAQHCAQALDRARLYETEHGARADAEAENRLKDDFLSTVSHELRTPLNAILGWAAMLRTGALDGGRTGRAIQAIHDNATRQAQLVDELLDVSRIAGGRAALDIQRMDLAELLRGAVESILPSAESQGLSVQLRAAPSLPIDGDARRLEQVFLNLLANAVKFTPEGGRVDVRVATSERHVEVQVADTGIGIEADFLPHAFDRFRQADSNTTRTHGGLGLGLSIARHLVDAHGGSIRVDSAGRNCGTTFTVSLPLPQPAAAGVRIDRSRTPEASRDMPDLTGIRVLVVDDEPDAREMMACALANCGVTVMTAGSCQEAIDALSTANIDVLLADIGMPVEDGYTLIRKVRSLPLQCASVPAAAVTAYAREDQRQQALAAGFQLHIAKPVDPPQLARSVASLLRHSPMIL